jgi:hypothetical protein
MDKIKCGCECSCIDKPEEIKNSEEKKNPEEQKKKEFLYMVTIQPYFEQRTQQYVHIMTLNAAPPSTDPLANIVKILPTPRVSHFIQEYEPFVYAVYDPSNTNNLITMSKIGCFFNYVIDNGYTINRLLSNVMTSPAMRNRAQGPKKDILCFIEK